MSVETEVAQLRSEFEEFKKDAEAHQRLAAKLERHVADFKESNSSRRGLPGVSIKGDPGPAGVAKVVTEAGKVYVLGSDGSRAEIVPVAGNNGADAPSLAEIIQAVPKPKDGRNGVDGKSAPDLSTIVTAVLEELKRRWIN